MLDALSDLYQSPHSLLELLDAAAPPLEDLVGMLKRLHSENYVFLTLNIVFNAEEVKNEVITGDRRYWFGRTEKGYLAWLECRTKYENTEEEK